ncbi:MAG TPA: Stk1 family PASTA domain-containing Ser/Thr kinase [Propionibacteriaceae bacterium]|nr:Stk1 family PASTA domain-containing Ser/Thr kinase [Propionibacteriaceae bacterium]
MPDDQVILADRYKLGDRLGRGGMAEVRRGFDLRLERTVAVKCLRVDLAADPAFQKRFQREAHAAASLNHPGIAAVYDTGEQVDRSTGVPVPFLVMELVDGPTLRDVLREEGPMPPERALELTRVVLGALGHSHAAGIVHRDIKPSNIMLTPKGDAKVMDFGIARAAAETTSDLTGTATVIGTAHYLSPEQARGQRVDQRSDLYSTGCLLYELLLGRPPFLGDSSVSVAYQHVREPPVPPSEVNPSIGTEVDAVVAKALAKDPADRYQSAEEMATDISRVLAGLPPHAAVPAEQDQDTHIVGAVSVPSPVTEVDEEATHGLRGPVRPAAAGAEPPPADGATVAGPPLTATTAQVGRADEPTEARRPPVGRTVLVAVLTLLVLGGLAFGAYRLLDGGPSNNVTVPSVLGNTRQGAEQALIDADLQPAFRNVDGPAGSSVGKVIRQDPDQGAEVAPGSTVTVEINVGPATERIPEDLIGRDVDDVVEELREAGFSNVTAVPVAKPPAGAKADEVVKIDPAEGEKAAPQEDITVSYVREPARAPTSAAEEEPGGGGGGASSRPSKTDRSAEASAEDEQPEERPSRSREPSGTRSSDEPSSEPSDTTQPAPSQPESPAPEPSASEPSNTGPPAEESPEPPAAGGEVEEPVVSADPAEATEPAAG